MKPIVERLHPDTFGLLRKWWRAEHAQFVFDYVSGRFVTKEAIQRIAQLYNVEQDARGWSPERSVALRLAKAKTHSR
jgi:hypothetical protein